MWQVASEGGTTDDRRLLSHSSTVVYILLVLLQYALTTFAPRAVDKRPLHPFNAVWRYNPMLQTLWRHFFGIGLMLLVMGGFYLLLRPFSPQAVDSPIYAIKFIGEPYSKRYQIQGNTLACQPPETPRTVRCGTIFEGQPLEVAVWFQNEEQRFIERCQVSYAGEAIGCQPSFDYENPASSVLIRDDLGVPDARFAELRQPNWWLYWDEGRWLTAVRLLALPVALATAVWHHWRSRHVQLRANSIAELIFDALLSGLLAYFILHMGMAMTFGYTLGRVIPWLAAPGAGLVAAWRWFTLSGRQPGTAVRLAASIGYGLFIFLALNFLLVGDLLWLGFVD